MTRGLCTLPRFQIVTCRRMTGSDHRESAQMEMWMFFKLPLSAITHMYYLYLVHSFKFNTQGPEARVEEVHQIVGFHSQLQCRSSWLIHSPWMWIKTKTSWLLVRSQTSCQSQTIAASSSMMPRSTSVHDSGGSSHRIIWSSNWSHSAPQAQMRISQLAIRSAPLIQLQLASQFISPAAHVSQLSTSA